MDHQTFGRWDNQPSDQAYYIEDCRISILILFCFIRPCRHSSALPLARMDWLDNPCSSCLLLHFRRNLQDHFENENKFNNIIPRWGIIATFFFLKNTKKFSFVGNMYNVFFDEGGKVLFTNENGKYIDSAAKILEQLIWSPPKNLDRVFSSNFF